MNGTAWVVESWQRVAGGLAAGKVEDGFDTRREAREWAAKYNATKGSPYRYVVRQYQRIEPKRKGRR